MKPKTEGFKSHLESSFELRLWAKGFPCLYTVTEIRGILQILGIAQTNMSLKAIVFSFSNTINFLFNEEQKEYQSDHSSDDRQFSLHECYVRREMHQTLF